MRIVIAVLVWLATLSLGLLIYWLGGGNFERSEPLGTTVLVSVMFAFLTAAISLTFDRQGGAR